MKRTRFPDTEFAKGEPRFFARRLDRDDAEYAEGFTHEIQILNDDGQTVESIAFADSEAYSEMWLPVPDCVYEATRGISGGTYFSSTGKEVDYNGK